MKVLLVKSECLSDYAIQYVKAGQLRIDAKFFRLNIIFRAVNSCAGWQTCFFVTFNNLD